MAFIEQLISTYKFMEISICQIESGRALAGVVSWLSVIQGVAWFDSRSGHMPGLWVEPQ